VGDEEERHHGAHRRRPAGGALHPRRGRPLILRRLWEHDLAWSFRRSPVTVIAAALTLVCVGAALLSPWLSPQDPFNPAALDLNAAFKPPAWSEGGERAYLLGSDNQGRDILSTIMHGARISLGVGLASVVLALFLGVSLGLLSGYVGGRIDALIMRVADVQLSFPAILIALLIDGVARVAMPANRHDEIAIPVLILAIGLAGWVHYARTVRGSTMVEREKEYVQAARVIGRKPLAIMLAHVLPNVMGPVLVLATLNIGTAIITEATLSFLGVGVPATRPSLGTLIRVGNEFLYSGEWWITVFPGVALVVLVLSVNLLGDWLRDALNPKLR
jgi:peptide/nickel transport system permease protein